MKRPIILPISAPKARHHESPGRSPRKLPTVRHALKARPNPERTFLVRAFSASRCFIPFLGLRLGYHENAPFGAYSFLFEFSPASNKLLT
jgi:hypothetical protein